MTSDGICLEERKSYVYLSNHLYASHMKDFADRILPRAIALVAVGLMAEAVNPEQTTWWLIFCFLGIAMVLEFLAFRHGVATGIQIYKEASPKQRADIDRIMEGEK